jgi:hypothetical protein
MRRYDSAECPLTPVGDFRQCGDPRNVFVAAIPNRAEHASRHQHTPHLFDGFSGREPMERLRADHGID